MTCGTDVFFGDAGLFLTNTQMMYGYGIPVTANQAPQVPVIGQNPKRMGRRGGGRGRFRQDWTVESASV